MAKQSRAHIERIRAKYMKLVSYMAKDDDVEPGDMAEVMRDGEKFFALLEYEDAIDDMLTKYEPINPLD